MQDLLGRRILVENVSTYVAFARLDDPRMGVLGEPCARTGCGILLDVNNLYVNAVQSRLRAAPYLAAIPFRGVGEIHSPGIERDRALPHRPPRRACAEPCGASTTRRLQRFGPGADARRMGHQHPGARRAAR